MDIHERLRTAREKAGFSTAAEASRLFGFVPETYRSHENGQRGFSRKTAAIYASKFRVSPEWLLFGTGEFERKNIPMIGYTGDGATIMPIADSDSIEGVEPMPGLGPDAEAIRVRGDSMYPRYFNGDTLIYDRTVELRNAHGKECVVSLTDGTQIIRTVRFVNNVVSLESFNAPPIDDADIDWVAPIVWVKRA